MPHVDENLGGTLCPTARPRTGRATYDLTEMLVIVICALFSHVEGFVDIALWARHKETWLRRFLPLKHGLPSHDTFNRLFRLLDPQAFEAVFRAWVGDVLGAFEQVAIDGKCLRGSGKRSPVHLVSAYATELGLALGQHKVEGKSNEITAIPHLLAALELKGCLVSLDAMGCQREIAQQIRAQGADYLLAVKGNQTKLREALEDAFADEPSAAEHEQVLRGHGRQSLQYCQVLPNTGQVDPTVWTDCRTLARVVSLRVQAGRAKQIEQRYYISSATLTPEQLAQATRRHWGIENGLHGCLDVILREDACAVKRDNAPQDLSLLRKMQLNLVRQDTAHPKRSLRLRIKAAGWDDDKCMRLLGMLPL